MRTWIQTIAVLAALAVIVAVGFAARGNSRVAAQQALASATGQRSSRISTQQAPARVAVLAAQTQPTAVPQPEPTSGWDTDTVEQQDGAQDADTTAGPESPDADAKGDSETADAAVLANKATLTADQAKAAALAAHPGATVVAIELDDENGVIVYSVELSTGADVKVDAQNGAIVSTDQAEQNDGEQADGTEAPTAAAQP